MSYFTTKDGCNIFYEEQGQGEHLLFVHGWSCNHNFFHKQVDHFAKNHHVITYDLRGHGQSDRGEITERNMCLGRFGKDLFELIEHLKLEKVNVVAWSMGVSTVLAYVREYGCQYLNKLCLIDMTPKLLNDNEWKLGQGCDFTHEMNVAFLEQISISWEEAATLFGPAIFSKNISPELEIVKWTNEQILNNTPHVMLTMWIAMAYEDFRPVLSKITVPVLLTYGDNGSLYFKVHGEYMAEHIAGESKLVMFHDCGHGLFLEAPDKFNAEVESFLK